MYDILQLKSKSLEELQSLAAEMGLKSAKSTDKNTLVYDILDEQAISASKNAPERDRKPKNRIRKDNANTEKVYTANGEKGKHNPAEKKREKAKNQQPEPIKEDAPVTEKPVEAQPEPAAQEPVGKKKAGRPRREPKQAVQDNNQPAPVQDIKPMEQPMQVAEPAPEIQHIQEQPANAPKAGKRRGRPSKSHAVEVPLPEIDEENITASTEAVDEQEPVSMEQPEPMHQREQKAPVQQPMQQNMPRQQFNQNNQNNQNNQQNRRQEERMYDFGARDSSLR